MEKVESQLDQLRKVTTVDCDTLDVQVPQQLGPFEDCTSNQAIALVELSKPENEDVIKKAASEATTLQAQYQEVSLQALAVEIAMVQLALRIVPHVNGHVHLQTNPVDAFSISRTFAGALRLITLAQHLQPGFDRSRLMIKVPSTWEGLQACRQLTGRGVKTLATTLFAIEQAIVAAEAGCHYVAPYLHDLRYVTQWPNFSEQQAVDSIKNALIIQEYFSRHGYTTQVITAALTSPDECFAASKCRMTISPSLIEELARQSRPKELIYQRTFEESDLRAQIADSCRATDRSYVQQQAEKLSYIDYEASFRTAFALRDRGFSEAKQIFAINEFCKAQFALQEMMQPYLKNSA